MTRYSVYVSLSAQLATYENVEVEADSADEAEEKAVQKIEDQDYPANSKFAVFPNESLAVTEYMIQSEGVEEI